MVLRERFWIDSSVQGVLVGRIVLYWFVAVLYLLLSCVCSQYYANPTWSFSEHTTSLIDQVWPWVPSVVLFLPLVACDLIRVSNLFVGPVYRLRLHLGKLLKTPDCGPLTFRDDDYWQDLIEPVNALQLEIMKLHLRVAELDEELRMRPVQEIVPDPLLTDPLEPALASSAAE